MPGFAEGHSLGTSSRGWPLQSEFQTCKRLPLCASRIATWPWYGGRSPKYPVVTAMMRPRNSRRGEAIFSRAGSWVMGGVQIRSENSDVALVRRPVPEVPGGHRNDAAAEFAQGRGDLLTRRQLGDGRGPDPIGE